MLARLDPAAAIAPLKDRLETRLASSGKEPSPSWPRCPAKRPATCSVDWLDRLIAGASLAEIQLDLIEAAAKRSEPEFREKIKKYQSTKPNDDPLAALSRGARGGRSRRGRTLFTSRAEIECVRCHKVHGPGGDDRRRGRP